MNFRAFLVKIKWKCEKLFAGFVDKFFPFVYKSHVKKFTESVVHDISKTAFIVSPADTLTVITAIIRENKNGAYMRFGDGDVFLAVGKKDMLQANNKKLSAEMQEAFSLKGPGIIKALAIHSEMYGREKEMYVGNLMHKDKTSNELVAYAYPFFVGYQVFSPVALHYVASYDPAFANDFLRRLKHKAVLFIGNENTKPEIVNRLFGNVKHVKTPPKNSFDKIDETEKESIAILDQLQHYGVVIVSMGCSGRVLMKRLLHKNYPVFYFDFGSLLDGISGNITRPWLKETIDYETLLKDL